jgi:hypothetical protein
MESERKFYFCRLTAILLTAILWPCLAGGQTNDFEMQLKRLEKNRNAVFYSQCMRPGRAKAVLLFGTGQKIGYLAEIDEGKVIDLSEFKVINGELAVGDTEGGLWSRERVLLLGRELATYPFSLLLAKDLKTIWSSVPRQTCSDRKPPS